VTLCFFEGPAGTGKTTRIFQELERNLEACPLEEDQRVLALTKMHGSRRRLQGRLAAIPALCRRYHCSTVDSFAWRVVRRCRSLARRRSESQLVEDDYDQVCALAGILLGEKTVERWVTRAFPVLVVDELQDSKGGQLEMIRALSASATCIAAADDFQDLEAAEENLAVAWAREMGEVQSLAQVYRTSASGLLAASRALREGHDLAANGSGFTVLGAPNHNVAASFVSKNLTWWSGCRDIAVLTPVRSGSSAFVREVIDRVEEKPISDPPFGPHRIPWEESQEEECERFIDGLGLPGDLNAELCAGDLSLSGASGPVQGLRDWFERQKRIAGRVSFRAEEIRLEARRNHQRSRAYRRVREGGVRAMTIHQAKNREFDSVVVLWPYEVAGSAERQRRLLYNAITRARRHALVVVQNPDRLHQQPFVHGA
jgi:superfamily I DNA/RNA helicase